MKLCKDCKHVVTVDQQGRAQPSDIWRCRLGSTMSVVDGATIIAKPNDTMFCAVRRLSLEVSRCKPEGLQWEPVEEVSE
jgi:hypothetical protein